MQGTLLAIDREDTLKKAEKLLRQGRLDLAIAEYERVVEDQPRDWNTANSLGDLYMRAAQPERAVAVYLRVADHLFSEGFFPKAGAIFKKILKITPDDERSQLQLAEISARQGLLVDAKAYLTVVGNRRRSQGDAAGADEIVVRLGALDPGDYEARSNAAAAIARSGNTAAAAARYREIHADLVEKGRDADALVALKEAVRCNPADFDARVVLARSAVERGAVDEAREYLDPQTAAHDPALLLALVDVELRSGHIENAQQLLPRVLALGAVMTDRVVALAWSLAESNSAAAGACVDAAAEASIARGEYAEAARILEEFATRVPGQVTALLKLVEVCVDGGLDTTMYEAQARLADAYLATGHFSEARVIAEDLVAREPWEAPHVHRLRQALQSLNVPDVDAVIAERVNSPAGPPVEGLDHQMFTRDVTSPAPGDTVLPPKVEDVAPGPTESRGSMEIDLTTVLGDLRMGDAPPPPPPAPQDLDRVFAGLRSDAAREDAADEAGEHMALARTYLEMGMKAEAVDPLETAARSPNCRFEAAGTLGRLARERGDLLRAVDWLEQAAEVPPPSVEEGRALLYDLGATLESAGESARALAVFLELQADADNYRDVAVRAARLARSETGG